MKPGGLFICRTVSVTTEISESNARGILLSRQTLEAPAAVLASATRPAFITRFSAILGLVALPGIASVFHRHLRPWPFMWLMGLSIFLGCKWLTLNCAQAPADWRTALKYVFLWPGMDLKAFTTRTTANASIESRWIDPLLVTLAGVFILLTAAITAIKSPELWVGWPGMLGIILSLHFGAFELLADYWRRAGRNVTSVMRQPLRATSLAEFWGERWNTAFNGLATEFIFIPVSKRLRGVKRSWLRGSSAALATMSVFAVSGLVHELVISFPARGGYGLPTAYFMLQGFAILFERSRIGRGFRLGHSRRGWLFTIICTAGPAFWLFHPPFVRNVILPMLQTLALNGKACL